MQDDPRGELMQTRRRFAAGRQAAILGSQAPDHSRTRPRRFSAGESCVERRPAAGAGQPRAATPAWYSCKGRTVGFSARRARMALTAAAAPVNVVTQGMP